jgi:hypothetical protein
MSNPLTVGYAYSGIWAYQYAEIKPNDNGTPILHYKDKTSETPIDNPLGQEWENVLKYAGQTEPKYTFAMENYFEWNNFSLDVTMVYYGGHVMRMREIGYFGMNKASTTAMDIAYLDAWTPENTETNIPGIGRYGNSATSVVQSGQDTWVQPADFIKIRNIVLGYNLPESTLQKVGLRKAQLRFQIDNLPSLWIRNKYGFDPENYYMRGVKLPTCFIIGVNIGF